MVRSADAYVTPDTLDEKARGWLAAVRAGVRPRPHLGIEPARCALLVIDAQRYFAHQTGRCYLPAAAAALPRIVSLRDAWRQAGAVVVYTRHGHEGPHDLGMLGRFFRDYIRADEPDAELVPALTPAPSEPVLRKTTYDAFHETPLEALLRDRGVSQVLVTGVLTHLCCETTARAAFVRGFEVYVAADATASRSEALHVGALRGMADGVAIVTSTGEALARCDSTT